MALLYAAGRRRASWESRNSAPVVRAGAARPISVVSRPPRVPCGRRRGPRRRMPVLAVSSSRGHLPALSLLDCHPIRPYDVTGQHTRCWRLRPRRALPLLRRTCRLCIVLLDCPLRVRLPHLLRESVARRRTSMREPTPPPSPTPIAPDIPPSPAPARGDDPPALSVPLTPLVGRQEDVAAALALLRQHRLLTITGPAGVGKTRLALALAEALHAEFPAGCLVVSLAHLREPTLVAPTIARALGLWDTPVPAQTRLLDRLRDARMLLVLDNYEHLLDAAP